VTAYYEGRRRAVKTYVAICFTHETIRAIYRMSNICNVNAEAFWLMVFSRVCLRNYIFRASGLAQFLRAQQSILFAVDDTK
jgi:hypothetical protein